MKAYSERIKEIVSTSNNGFADFPHLDSLTIQTLRDEGYTVKAHRYIFISGQRVYSPDYSPEKPMSPPAIESLVSGDVEGAILSRQSKLISTI
jgi:hypothetical protein